MSTKLATQTEVVKYYSTDSLTFSKSLGHLNTLLPTPPMPLPLKTDLEIGELTFRILSFVDDFC